MTDYKKFIFDRESHHKPNHCLFVCENTLGNDF